MHAFFARLGIHFYSSILNTMPLLLAIEGNIGIARSTLLNKLKQHYRNDSSVVFVDEPVDTWEEKGLLAEMRGPGSLHSS